MTIEFADPGYNWAFVWWTAGLFVLGLFLFFLPFFLTNDERKIGSWPVIGLLIFILSPAILLPWGADDYERRVLTEKVIGLDELGFERGSLQGDRFTAATEDGKYFEGVLVDLRPESGYAYRVLELTETGE